MKKGSGAMLESLEQRLLLSGVPGNVFATFRGVVPEGGSAPVSVHLRAEDFGIAGGSMRLGFRVLAREGSALDPAVPRIRDASGNPVQLDPRSSDLSATESVALADLRYGSYTVSLSGDAGTAGAYRLQVYLVGDADGDRVVDDADRALTQGMLGKRRGDLPYRVEADADLDGLVTGFDLSRAILNQGDTTRISPLSVTLGVTPPPLVLPDGTLLTNIAASAAAGQSNNGATVTLDVDGDGFDDGSAAVGADRAYSLPALLQEGPNTLAVRARDGFGQQRKASLSVTLDSTPPAASIGPSGTLDESLSSFDVSFSEPMAASAFAAGSYALTESGQAVAIASVAEVNSTTARIILAGPLPDGSYQFTIGPVVTDIAANPVAAPSTFSFIIQTATGIAEISPATGEEMVGLERETIVRFAGKIDPATVTADSFYLIAKGQKIPGTIRVSPTGRFASFFQSSPLPSSTEVRVVVDGDKLLDVNGKPVDADGDRQPGGVATADFKTLPLTRIKNTNVFGYVYDSYHKNPDGSNIPVVGATIRVDALPGVAAVTDATGFFELKDMPAPEFFVHIDGTTAINAPPGTMYPSVGKPFHSVPGQRVQLEMDGKPFDVFLPPMAMSDVVTLSPTEDTEVGFGDAGKAELQALFPDIDPSVWDKMKVTYPAGSAVDKQGNVATEATVIPVPPDRLPAPLPPGQDPGLVISIQAIGATNFETPAPVTFPNLTDLKPGDKSLIWSFNHDAGRWEIIGTGTVSADGLMVVSDAGVGVRAPGWHFTEPGVDGDGDPDDNPPDPDEEEDDVTFEVGLGIKGTFKPLTVGVEFTLEVPLADDNPLKDRLPRVTKEFSYPTKDGIPFDAVASATFTVPADAAKYVPTFDLPYFGLEGLAGVRGQVALLGELDFDLGSPVAAIEAELVANIEAYVGVNLSSAFFCDWLKFSLPGGFEFDASDLICKVHEVPVPLIGLPKIESPEFSIPLPFVSVEDKDYKIGPKAVVFAETSLTIGPRVYLRRVSAAASASSAMASGEVEGLPLSAIHPLSETVTDISSDTLSPASTLDSLADSDKIFYRLQFENGVEQVGSVNRLAGLRQVLPPEAGYNLFAYSPDTNGYAILTGETGASGSREDLSFRILQTGGADSDSDTVPDIGEFVMGTNPKNRDSDNDGILDAAEIEQGLNPLDGRAFPTGVTSSLQLPGTANSVAVEGDNVYVATGSHGLAIIDGAQFNNPILLGQIDLAGDATDVGVDAALQRAVVATNTGGVQIIDVSDPMDPKVAHVVNNILAARVEVADGVAYVTRDNILVAIDVLTGATLQTLTLPGSGSVTGLAREGSVLYVFVSGSDTFAAIDISAEGAAFVRGQLNVSVASSDVGVFVGNGVAWLAGSGLRTINVSNPATPTLISNADSFFTSRRVALNGSGLGIVAPDGGATIEIYDTSNPANTASFVTRLNLSAGARDVAISRGIAYVAAGGRLEVVNYLPFDNRGVAPTATISSTVPDADPATPGVQVVEGGSIPIRADINDDVQVRNVELLVNGQVVANDVSFPFDFSAVALSDNPNSPVLTVQVRATDTGGNTVLSNVLSIDLVPDTFAPQVAGITPADGSQQAQGHRTVRVRFSEPIDAAGVTPNNFSLVGAGADGLFDTEDDLAVSATLQLRDGDELVQMTSDPLDVGLYEVRINRDGITDRAGNPLGSGVLTSGFEVIEAVPVLINFDGGFGAPRDYSESGLKIVSRQDHLHMGDNNGDRSPDLMNHDSCCSTPYVFTFNDGAPFSVVSMKVNLGSFPAIFTSSAGSTVSISSPGLFTFPDSGWQNITSFSWDQPFGQLSIDDLLLLAAPVDASFAATVLGVEEPLAALAAGSLGGAADAGDADLGEGSSGEGLSGLFAGVPIFEGDAAAGEVGSDPVLTEDDDDELLASLSTDTADLLS